MENEWIFTAKSIGRKKTHKEIIYVSDINKNLNHCAQSLKRQYLGQQ